MNPHVNPNEERSGPSRLDAVQTPHYLTTAALRSVAVAVSLAFASTVTAANYEFYPLSIANGGGVSAGANYTFSDTIAQPVQGVMSGGNFVAQLGWQFQLLPAAKSTGVDFDNLFHSALGNASLSLSSNGLLISNLGSSGQDGVSLALLELSRTARVQFAPVPLTSAGAGFTLGLTGMVNDVPERSLGHLFLRNNNGTVELGFLDQPDSWQWLRLDLYNDETLVGSANTSASGVLTSLSGSVRLTSITVGEPDPTVAEWSLFDLTFANVVNFSVPGASGNRLRLVTLNPAGPLQNLMKLAMTGANLDSVLIEQENATRFQPRLRIAQSGQQLQLNWDTRTSVLQSAPTINGPWTDLAQNTGALAVSVEAANKFFRIKISSSLVECAVRKLQDPDYVCKKRNVLLIIADDFGVDQCPWYFDYYNSNANKNDDIAVDTSVSIAKTPTIDTLAQRGVRFLNAWSSPVCSPTRAGLYTGTCSFRHGIYKALGDDDDGLQPGARTIAHVLNDEGYKSGLFGKWHLGTTFDGDKTPVSLFGWYAHWGALGGGLRSYRDWDKITTYTSILPGTSETVQFSTQHNNWSTFATKDNVQDALDWIGAQTGPWMATVAFNAPHWSGTATHEYEIGDWVCCRRADSDNLTKYRSMVECMDYHIEALLSGIGTDIENTTIIFVGDNGTDSELGINSSSFPSDHTKGSLYEGGINVPLIITDGYTYLHGQQNPSASGAGRVVAPGRSVSALVQTTDLFATIAEIGGGDASSGKESVSLVPYLETSWPSPIRDAIFAETREYKPDGTPKWTGCGDAGWHVAVQYYTYPHYYKLIVKNYGSKYDDEREESYELYDLGEHRWEKDADMLAWDPESEIGKTLLAQLAALLPADYACK